MTDFNTTKKQGLSACQSNNVKNGKIEFLRFMFAMIIVIYHSRGFLGDDSTLFWGGSLSVEFFFLVSGYLMMATVEKKNLIKKSDKIGAETAMFIGKKWISIIPESIISWIIAFLVMCIAEERTVRSMVERFIDGIWEPLFITMTGLGQRGANGAVWYVSAMLLCMAILYPLLRRYYDVMIHIVIPIIILCVFGCFFRNFGSPRSPTQWLGWTYKGVLRAFAEIGIGCLLYPLAKYIRSFQYTQLGKFIISLVENSFYIFTIGYMYFCGASKHDYFFIALLACSVALTFSSSGIDSELFNNKITLWLGRFSVPLYFSHNFYAGHLNYYVSESLHVWTRLLIYVGISIVTSLFVMLLSQRLRIVIPAFAAKFKKTIIIGKKV